MISRWIGKAVYLTLILLIVDRDGQASYRIRVNPGTRLKDSVSSGWGFHTCQVMGDGTVRCWGANGFGQLGDGTFTDQTAPVSVPNLSGVQAVSAGASHTCALLTGGSVRCWGLRSQGQLGDGTQTT